ncbi:MAG: putative 2OG-Fe(II) oxygenase [Steroidobacteraceae bacterium]
MTKPPTEASLAQWQAQFRDAAAGHRLTATDVSAGIDLARGALGTGRADLAISILELLTNRLPRAAPGWQLLGFAYRDEQRMRESLSCFARAAELAPEDALSALAHAETRFESGLAAAQLARRALELAPDNPAAVGCCATALAGEGQRRAAENLLVGALARQPDWLEGQKLLATLRWTGGDSSAFARGYAAACRTLPRHLPLRLAWFRMVAQARDWEAAARIIDDCERSFGMQPAFAVARVFIASESGDRARAAVLFEQTSQLRDEVRELAWIRYCLRIGQPEQAVEPALRLTSTVSARLAWPYLSLIWRLTGDARAAWLDGAPPYIRSYDLEFSADELEELTVLLRGLHTAKSPYLEQSVRGGTQTDRPLFFRHEAIIATWKSKIVAALREYIAALPAPEPDHPLLGTPREQLLFAGSWSVRLQAQGYHVSHTHPQGWISSALYVALPLPAQLGAPPAGWLEFGRPAAELGLYLPAYAQVEPRPGRLVLCPSTMWHATVPFQDGERTTIAFDVRPPAR